MTERPVWETVETVGKPHARHEAAFVGMGEKLYLLGGRGIKPVDIYHPANKTWTKGAVSPVEVHHFQPVTIDQKIWLVGAMTGKYPKEQALDHIPIYDPAKDVWSRGASLPEARRRGGAGAVVHEGKLYVVCGIINGHWDGNVAWLDVCDLKTGEWRRLPDAPRARDHFQAAVIDGKIYAAGGRQTSGATKQVFDLVISEVDVFDIKAGQWSTVASIPTPRAGTASIALNHLLVVAGGESVTQKEAHSQVERFDPKTGQWDALPSLARGRHGTGLVWFQNGLHIAAGCGNRGGSPELDSLERLEVEAD
jgi:N-acetylneuraminic acid mutarotase